jgi:hypothetical protein
MEDEHQTPQKDPDSQHPIASSWRPVFREIVKAFANRDFGLVHRPAAVVPISGKEADRIAANIASYGETLTELPEETWKTSVSQWMDTHWDVRVDLWTVESGRSDLVLSARVFEDVEGFLFEVGSVYVP